MKGGDVITQIGDNEVSDIYSYMEALGKFKKGDATTVTVLRGNQTLKFNVVF